ncbi:MAG: PIN domain-containing protein [Candidatus Competibacteraceae bacterium]|nr:MAG: PIN domain-containing protein [Candidatus Competibacteraceae bacterium]
MIIADTGFWVALFNRRDDLHRQAKACAAQIQEPLITTLPVMTEVYYLLQTRCGHQRSVEFLLAQQEGLFQIFALGESELPQLDKLLIRSTLHDILQFVSVGAMGLPVVETAWILLDRYRFSYFDSLILASALTANCEVLYSEDLQHGQVIDGRLTIINPLLPDHSP